MSGDPIEIVGLRKQFKDFTAVNDQLLPLNDETRHLMDAERLGQMKEGALLVNIARGPLVDTAALLNALDAGRLGGAALDVFDAEPLPPNSPLWDHPRVLLTPHNSFMGEGNASRLNELIMGNLAELEK